MPWTPDSAGLGHIIGKWDQFTHFLHHQSYFDCRGEMADDISITFLIDAVKAQDHHQATVAGNLAVLIPKRLIL